MAAWLRQQERPQSQLIEDTLKKQFRLTASLLVLLAIYRLIRLQTRNRGSGMLASAD